MGTPTNRTPVRVARGSTTALNTGLSDIQEGEIVWDTTLNKLQVKEGSALEDHTVAADATKASLSGATFTGGINLADGIKLTLGNGAGDDYNPGSYEIYESGGLYLKSNGGHIRNNIPAGQSVLLEGPTGSLAKFIEGGASELYHDDVKKLETKTTGVDVTGTLECNTLQLPNSSEGEGFHIKLGTGAQTQMFQTADDGFVIQDLETTADKYSSYQGQELRFGAADSSELYCTMKKDGAVNLYYDNAKKFETTSSGVTVTGAAVPASITALTDGATIATDLALNNNYSVTLAGNRTLGQPTNQTVGQSGSIFVTQDGTGGRTLAYHADWKWAGGTAPTLSTAASSVDRIDYIVAAANKIHAVATLAVA